MEDLLSVPNLIKDRFEVIRPLGAGGFATVYLAKDKNLERQVAIKVYHIDKDDAGELDREAKILGRLKHPNIVTVYDSGILDEGHRPFIVMEFLPGGSLRERLTPEAPPMRTQDALGLVAVLAEALGAAHDSDILHLDIKPENIIFDQRGRPYLTDFGIGRIMGGDGETKQTRAMGSGSYASPEQRQGGNLSRASDIYSLGVVLFELLTKQLPLGPAPAQPQPPYSPPFPMNHPVTAAKELVMLVCKALAVAPAYRYESANQFAHQLRDYILHASGATGHFGPPTRQGGQPSITKVQIREPERNLRPFESRRVPQTVLEMTNDLPPVPSGTRVPSLIYSHQKLEVGVASMVEEGIFGRGPVRLRQDAVVKGDVISLTMIDISQGAQATNLLAPEVVVRGPIRLEGSIFCRRLRPAQGGPIHLPENSELGGSLIFAKEFERIVPDDEIGRPLLEPRPPIDVYKATDVRIGTNCTLVAILGEVNVEVDPRQKQLNTIRVTGNVRLGRSNEVRRIEGEDVYIDSGCVVNEVHARGKLIIEQGSTVGYARAGKGIQLAHKVTISSPVLFADNGTILEKGEAHWAIGKERASLTAYHIFDSEGEGQRGSLATILLDHRLYELYDRIAPRWMPRLKPTPFQGSADQVVNIPVQAKSINEEAESYSAFPLDLTPADLRDPDAPEAPVPLLRPRQMNEPGDQGAIPAAHSGDRPASVPIEKKDPERPTEGVTRVTSDRPAPSEAAQSSSATRVPSPRPPEPPAPPPVDAAPTRHIGERPPSSAPQSASTRLLRERRENPTSSPRRLGAPPIPRSYTRPAPRPGSVPPEDRSDGGMTRPMEGDEEDGRG